MIKKYFITSLNLLFIITALLTACAIKPLNQASKLNYIVINKNTQTGKLIEKHLNRISNPNGEKLTVELSHEKMTERTFSVNERGEANRYIKELQIHLKVIKDEKILTNEYIFSSQESPESQSLSSVIETQQLSDIMTDLSYYVFSRLNEIANSKKDDAIFTKQLKKDLKNKPKSP